MRELHLSTRLSLLGIHLRLRAIHWGTSYFSAAPYIAAFTYFDGCSLAFNLCISQAIANVKVPLFVPLS